MATQYDVNPGLDLSALSSATLAQIQQAIAQIAPLSNIGGIVYSATTPDVANNPRFARYMWIDIGVSGTPTAPVWKLYDGVSAWNLATLADASVTNAKIANYAVSVLNASSANKIAYKHDASAVGAKSNYILRLDSAGQYVEVVALSTILAADTVPLTALALGPTARSSSGSANKILSFDNTGANIGFYAFSNSLIVDGSLDGAKLADTSVTNAKLIDKTISPGKLLFTTGDKHKVPTVNAGETAIALAIPTIVQQAAVKTITPTVAAALGAGNMGASGLFVTDGTSSRLAITFTPLLTTSYLELEANVTFHCSTGAGVGLFVHDGTTIFNVVTSEITSALDNETQSVCLRALVASPGSVKTYTVMGFKNNGETSVVTMHQSVDGNFGNQMAGYFSIKEVNMGSLAIL